MTTSRRQPTVPVHRATMEYANCCVFDFTISTTGPQGGDAGHGGYTELMFENRGGTNMLVSAGGWPVHNAPVVLFRFNGDDEMAGLEQALEFALRKLREFRRDGTVTSSVGVAPNVRH